jgi:hypothetical protein
MLKFVNFTYYETAFLNTELSDVDFITIIVIQILFYPPVLPYQLRLYTLEILYAILIPTSQS